MLTLTDKQSGQHVVIESGTPTVPSGFFRENRKYRIDFETSGRRDISLLVSDEQLLPAYKEITEDKTRVRWDWQITEYAGEAILTLLDGDVELMDAIVDIAPNPYKLGSDAYRELLLDLQEKAEGLVFGKTAALVNLEHNDSSVPPLARFAMLRSYLPALERAFRTIEQAPHRRLIAVREERPLHKIQRVDSRSLRTALKRMPVLAALSNRRSVTAGEFATLDVPRREHTYNTSPNRYVLATLNRLVALCAQLGELFEETSINHDTETDNRRRAARWAILCQRFEKRLKRLPRTDFLIGLKASRPDAAALMTVARDPSYSHFDRIARHILTPRIALGGDLDKLMGLRATYNIYEYWCFFMVAEAVKAALPDLTWQSHIAITAGQLLLNLRNGSSIEATDGEKTFSVAFQKKYARVKNEDGFYSISKKCIPDIVLTIKKGQEVKTIILDAKYRSAADSIHAALSDIHVYRDAIRMENDQPGIHAAFILTPSHASDLDRYYTHEYRTRHSFGGFDLSPRNSGQMDELVVAIRRLVSK